MTNKIKISVIINTFNYAHYLEDAIKSALMQSLSDELYEIIVIDDGSTDNTSAVASKFLPNIIYHYQENSGQASALNVGISMARGEFVTFLDADDYWHQDKLSHILNSFKIESSVDVVYHALQLVDDADRRRGVIPAVKTPLSGQPVLNNLSTITSQGGATSGISWRRSALEKLLPIPDTYRICADAYLMICAPIAARKFVFLDKPLGYYRIHGTNFFSELTPVSATVYPKSEYIAAYYRKLCLNDLIQLSTAQGHSSNGAIMELNAICLGDKLVEIKKHSGVLMAIFEFWRSRNVFTGLPVKQRLYRIVTTSMKLFISPRSFVLLQTKCSNSNLWCMVQRYIKGDKRYALP